MQNLPRERVSIGTTALAAAETVFEQTLEYWQAAPGASRRPIGSFQYNRFVLAEMATELAVARAFTDRAVTEHVAGRLSNEDASMLKWWDTELLQQDRRPLRPAARRLWLHARVPRWRARSRTAGRRRSSAAPRRS